MLREGFGPVSVAEMAHALEADARAHESAELSFGFVVASTGDSCHQVGVAQPMTINSTRKCNEIAERYTKKCMMRPATH